MRLLWSLRQLFLAVVSAFWGSYYFVSQWHTFYWTRATTFYGFLSKRKQKGFYVNSLKNAFVAWYRDISSIESWSCPTSTLSLDLHWLPNLGPVIGWDWSRDLNDGLWLAPVEVPRSHRYTDLSRPSGSVSPEAICNDDGNYNKREATVMMLKMVLFVCIYQWQFLNTI